MVKTIQKFANQTPIKFWSFLLTLIALVILGIFFIFLNPALNRDLSSSQDSKNVDSYPLILQKDIHLGIESILKKVVGVGRYEISVVANVNYEKVVKSSVSYESEGNNNEDSLSDANLDFELPGMFSDAPAQDTILDDESSDLPGFADLFGSPAPEPATQKTPVETPAKEVEISPIGSIPSGKNGYKQIKEYVKKDYEINGFLISVVVDGNYFSPTDKAILDLKSLIQHLGVIDPKRGDKLEIRVIEFSDLSSDSTFLIRTFKSILFNPILIILVVVSILGFIAFKFISQSKQAKAIAKMEEEKEAKLQEVENAKNAEAERLRTEKAYQELLATFDNSPDVTANILSDWMESGDSSAASTGEEAAEEGEETAG
tara:strand:+ start:339 stop:1457 length:1119 start_codon:yes stop_codon:yes gene_type:complete